MKAYILTPYSVMALKPYILSELVYTPYVIRHNRYVSTYCVYIVGHHRTNIPNRTCDVIYIYNIYIEGTYIEGMYHNGTCS